LSVCLKMSIANVCSPVIKMIELGKEDKKVYSVEGNNTSIDAVKQDLSKMSICNKHALVVSIVLHIKDKVNTDFSVTFRWFLSFIQILILEGLALMQLGHLKGIGVLPLGVSIEHVKLNGMVVILWDFITILVAWCHAVGPELGLVNHVKELLVASCNAFEPFPSIKIK